MTREKNQRANSLGICTRASRANANREIRNGRRNPHGERFFVLFLPLATRVAFIRQLHSSSVLSSDIHGVGEYSRFIGQVQQYVAAVVCV